VPLFGRGNLERQVRRVTGFSELEKGVQSWRGEKFALRGEKGLHAWNFSGGLSAHRIDTPMQQSPARTEKKNSPYMGSEGYER